MKSIKYALLGLAGVIGMLVSMFGPVKVPFAEALAKSYYRYALGALLVILLLISLAVGLFIGTFDANNFKAEIVQFVKARTQRDLVLEGNIKVTFFPKLGLDSGRASLSQRNSAKEFASINNARLYIAWLPLFRRQLVFDHIEIDGARINLSRLKDGATNFDDLLISDEHLAPLTFDIDSVRVTDSSINWQDEMAAQQIALHGLHIETGRLADVLSSHMTADFRLISEKARLDAGVNLKSRLFFDRKAGRYEFADINGNLHGKIPGVDDLALNFAGSVDSYPAQGALTVENLLVSATGTAGLRSFDSRISAPMLKISRGALNGTGISFNIGSTHLDESLLIALQLPAFEYASNVFKAGELTGEFDFKGQARALHAKFSSPLGINLDSAPLLHMDAITLSLSARHPALSVDVTANATGNLKVDVAAQSASAGFIATMGDSKFTSAISLKGFNHPAYTFDISANRLDLAQYLSADWLKRFRDDGTPFEAGMLRDMKLYGNLRAGEITMGNFKASKLAAGFKVEQSTLAIAPLTAKLYGGALSGSISVAAQNSPQITVKQSLKGFRMDALLADTAGAGRLTGKGDFTMNVSAAGDSIGALRKSLNGRASLALARGSFAGIDLTAALLEGKSELGTGIAPRSRETKYAERSDFSSLLAAFNFSDGKSGGNTFEMRSPLIRSAGQGDIDLDTGNIDYRLDVSVSPAVKSRTAGMLAVLRGVTVPARISGPYATPAIELDFSAASGGRIPKPVVATTAKDVQPAQTSKSKVVKQPASPGRTQGR